MEEAVVAGMGEWPNPTVTTPQYNAATLGDHHDL